MWNTLERLDSFAALAVIITRSTQHAARNISHSAWCVWFLDRRFKVARFCHLHVPSVVVHVTGNFYPEDSRIRAVVTSCRSCFYGIQGTC
uniref:Secreted protein n=1 Tax=Setaria digitata TaxID=48799 RepID=A0A915PPS6_9BILA